MLRLIFLCLAFWAPPAAAGLDDMTRAREALERDEVLPLATILGMVQEKIDARVIEVEFEEENGQYIYEFELITPDGRLLEAIADAVTGEILSIGEDVED
ncbi:PepSY domain-containing protein [Amaricoccus sp.]|uniref:PepSY domain-containing protein n=1 Tax=Amaricoccus sp. TaxID=1872485 RepID=UPI00261A1374|nr:PepSY domain-containing protein [Amaricoccus sp.]HRO11771.1 PepSY domain-containing protein [Amaricoccus sp.]